MATIDWPASLPQEILLDSYERQSPDLLLESPMDQGPPKVRRKSSNTIEEFPASMIMTAAQLSVFKTFWSDTLLSGALRFNFTDPDDGTTAIEIRIPSYRSTTFNARANFIVDMQMVIYP